MTEKMTDGRDPETGRFLAGNNGGGRQKGSRNKLGEAFVADVYAKWQARGVEALDRMIDTDPGGFVRVVAQVLPDKLEVDVKHTIAKIEWNVVDHRPHADTPLLPVADSEPVLLSNSNSLVDEER